MEVAFWNFFFFFENKYFSPHTWLGRGLDLHPSRGIREFNTSSLPPGPWLGRRASPTDHIPCAKKTFLQSHWLEII